MYKWLNSLKINWNFGLELIQYKILAHVLSILACFSKPNHLSQFLVSIFILKNESENGSENFALLKVGKYFLNTPWRS